MLTEEQQERIAIISEGCKITQEQAVKRFKALSADKGIDFANKAIETLKNALMKRKSNV